jgi:ABC-type transporter Mla MlaB component
MELTGELMFASAEIIVASATDHMKERQFLIFDLNRVVSVDQSASTLLAGVMEQLCEQGKQVLVTGLDRHYRFGKYLRQYFRSSQCTPRLDLEDVDAALEYAEDVMLETSPVDPDNSAEVPLNRQPLLRDLDLEEMNLLTSMLSERRFNAGDVICREGDPADLLYFLVTGRVSVSVKVDRHHRRRLAASAAGWIFGEAALFDQRKRTADILADTPVLLYELRPSELQNLETPVAMRTYTKLLKSLAEIGMARLQRANREIKILTS